jgi:hypothetical protein
MGGLDDADFARWIDPRGPDGVTIVAPFEQAKPDLFPGAAGGDAGRPMMLFDLEADPAERHDVAARHPDVVTRLKAMFDEHEKQVPADPQRPAAGKKE